MPSCRWNDDEDCCAAQASVVVQTQLNAGSAERVPGVLAELRNVTAGGQLKVRDMPVSWLHCACT